MENTGERFLHKKDSRLHTSNFVEHEKERRQKAGEKISQKPADKIADWLEKVEEIHTGHRESPEVMERIKKYYHKEHVIKPEDVPESAFLLEQRILREEGWGDVEITDEFRRQKKEEIVSNQKKSLDKWVNYLSSEDANYPAWAKYWAFSSVLQMGKLEKLEKEENGVKKESIRFTKRTKDTTASFPVLNARALAMSVGVMRSKLEQEKLPKKERDSVENLSVKLSDADFRQLLSTENFSKLYAQFLLETPVYSKEGLQETRGKWVKYDRESDPQLLVDSLEGYPLEWCTADIETAKTHLQGGDFYVYYSINEMGKAVIPRLAIRMENKRIAEVRGIAHDQNLDPYIGDVLEKKLQDFPDGEAYKKRTADMKYLTEIDQKIDEGQELTADDLRFLYEFDSKIDGFGYEKDPRIKEILDERDIKTDLSLITGYSVNQISLTEKEALRKGIKFHYGDLDLSGLKSVRRVVLPETVSGSLDLSNLKSGKRVVLPKTVNEHLYLSGLKSAEGLVLPKTVNGDLDLSGLESAEGLVLPERLNGSLRLPGLESAKGLVLPETLNGGLGLFSLKSAEGLVLPKTVNGYLDLHGLKSAEGLVLPETVNGGLFLQNLESAEGVIFPRTMNGGIRLLGLKSTKGLVLPETMNGHLDFAYLDSVEGLVLPKTMNDNIYLQNLELAEGLVLPETMNGNLDLYSLESVEELVLPRTMNGYLGLSGLESARRLVLPETMSGNLSLLNLRSAEGVTLPKTMNGDLNLGFVSAEGLVLPETMSGEIRLDNLRSAEGVVFPKKMKGVIYLRGLKSAEGLVLPEEGEGCFVYTSLMKEEERLELEKRYPQIKILNQ